MSKLRLLISTSHNPWFNLAVEEVIFHAMPPTQKVLFLWRNADTVVIGRAQNPWKECNTKRMQEDGVTLARRSSGGGAVFHDLGNTCFTFMAGKPDYDKDISTQMVIDALSSLGVSAQSSGRNDLVIQTNDGTRKISGSAYKETKDRGFHHGTLLLNADLTRLANYLHPDPKKLQSKGITSVRSRVANLSETHPQIDHAQICTAITQAFFEYYDAQSSAEYISPEQLPNLPQFAEVFEKQSSWEWNFGSALPFTHSLSERFAWGGVDMQFNVEDGTIVHVQIFTDSLQPEPLEELAKQLRGSRYDAQTVQSYCQNVEELFPQQKTELSELTQWMAEALK